MFCFDVTKRSSFEKYLKMAIKNFIFECDENPEMLRKKYLPFMLLGFKKDLDSKVPKEDVNELVRVMKEYIRCEMLYVSSLLKCKEQLLIGPNLKTQILTLLSY